MKILQKSYNLFGIKFNSRTEKKISSKNLKVNLAKSELTSKVVDKPNIMSAKLYFVNIGVALSF